VNAPFVLLLHAQVGVIVDPASTWWDTINFLKAALTFPVLGWQQIHTDEWDTKQASERIKGWTPNWKNI
jgi:hypothetical protein